MYTHLYVNHDDAEKLFNALAPKPLESRQTGQVVGATLDEHFLQFTGSVSLRKIEAVIELKRSESLFVLKFPWYLPEVPWTLIEMGITVTKAEIVRMKNAPTKARAGYYEDPETGFSATVERIVLPTQKPLKKMCFMKSDPPHAQNIWIVGPTLKKVQGYNTRLSQGDLSQLLVNAFE